LILKGALSGILIRSPIGRGRLRGMDVPKLPGSVTLIQAQDIPGENSIGGFGLGGGELPVLASQKLSYIGEPVALLVGPDETKLRELAEQCIVKIEKIEKSEPVFEAGKAGGFFVERNFTLGNIDKAFGGDPINDDLHLIEGTYNSSFQEAWATDPSGAAAIPIKSPEPSEPRGVNPEALRYELHTATQWPFHVKQAAAEVLGLSPQMITVKPSRLEIHLDSKLWFPSLCACHAALGAYITGKPVKIMLRREEDFRFSPKRAETEIFLQSTLGNGGRILGTKLRVRVNMGAQGIFAQEILDRICLGALGAYHHESLFLEAQAAITNLPPSGPLSGLGLAQGFFAMERHASLIADSLWQDPLEWRKNMFLHKGMKLASGAEIKDNVSLERLLDTASSMADYNRKWASYELLRRSPGENPLEAGESLRGIGISAAWQGSGFLYPPGTGQQGVELTLEKDGSLEIRTSMISSFEEQIFPWKTIAARELGVNEEQVRVVSESNAAVSVIPDSGPACLSRNIAHITKLVERACSAIKKQHFRDPLPITVRRGYRPGKGMAWGTEPYDENALSSLSWGSAVVELEVDTVEYIPRIRGIWMAIDGGPILAENRARKRLTELVIQALNWVSREEVRYEDGKIPDTVIRNYPLIRMEEIPPITLDFLWSEGEPKGIGELPFNTIPSAYAQALAQALDYPFRKVPVTPADIWVAVQKLGKAGEKEGP
jgi:CO/xanthine dehydrogenase Mo-binding subunit